MADQKSNKVEFRFQDLPDLAETFADSVGPWHFDGGTLRMEFLVTRFDEMTSRDKRSGRSSRLKAPLGERVPTSSAARPMRQFSSSMRLRLTAGTSDLSWLTRASMSSASTFASTIRVSN